MENTNGLAIAAMIVGICGILFLWFIGPIAALIMGIIALKKVKTNNQNGKGMAIAGIVLGAVGIIIGFVFILIGAIAYFGVLSTDGFLPERCVMTGGFSCMESTYDGNNLVLGIQNNFGQDVNDVTIGIEGGPQCTNEKFLGSIANGAVAQVTFTCKGGDRINGDLTISFNTGNLEQSAYGSVYANTP